jgi:hypothetical protein
LQRVGSLESASFLSALAVTLCSASCQPPPPAPAAPVDPTPPGTRATTEPDRPPEASTPYPASPKAPPPVAPPDGEGKGVAFQKYIVVDQFGYRPDMNKVAVLVNPEVGWNARDSYTPSPELEVRSWADGSVKYRGPVVVWNGGALDESAGDRGAWFDFSQLEQPGLYYVFDPGGKVRSHPFEIAPGVYRGVLRAAVKMFYFNRANFEKKPPHSCVGDKCWSLGADYLGPGQDAEARSVTDRGNEKTARDLRGGWWDAGDVNKYVTFSNDAFHQLLSAYEERPSAFGDDFGIPESGNGLPDLMDEILVELAWLKKMQPADLGGGALIKMGNVDYGDPVPDESRFARFYYPKPCSSATIVMAGQLAHAALVLRKFDGLKKQVPDLTARARRAWAHYHQNPKSDACDDGTIKSGDADRSLTEQSQAAVASAVYLFALTGDRAYADYVQENYAFTRPFQEDRWSVYDQSQGDALLYYAALPNADAATKQAILTRKEAQANSEDLYKFRPELDLYRAFMRPDSYHWGSNNARASFANTNYDVLLHGLVPDAERPSYRERAAGILHSFHGVNPLQLVYLTNMYAFGGDACADEAFHTWFRDGHPKWDNARTSELGPAPGYVTGGPNKRYCEGQDATEHACTRSPVRMQPPEKAYLDVNTGWEPRNPYDKSWELTEPAIYYQASYVRLLSKFVD